MCYLPKNRGSLTFQFLKLFYSGIYIDESELSTLRQFPPNAIIVYVSKRKSYFEYLFFHNRYQLLRLPFPEIGFEYRVLKHQSITRILKVLLAHTDHFFKSFSFSNPYENGYIEKQLLNGQTAFLSLVDEKGFYRRFIKKEFDPIHYLIKAQRLTNRPIILLPQLIFFSKKPERAVPTITDILFGSEGNPGKIRRLISLFRNPGNVFVEISEPINLKEFIAQEDNQDRTLEHQSLILRRNLLIQLNRHRQTITGPVLKSREELTEHILTNEQLRDFMKNYSQKRNIPLYKVYREAESYLKEIAANYSLGLINIFSTIVKWILDLMFDGVTVNKDELNMVKKMYQKGPLIFIPCHKSHIDYLILNYVLYQNNLPCPHVAAGKNLSFWPLGPIFRGGGAFFIRRTFSGAVLYSKVFAEYIKKLLEEGFNIEFFIEGGRSRTGKLILPKLGLLSILLNAYKNKACEDMVFVPIYIGYDQILEESSYLNEIEGGQKKPESFAQVINARKFLKKRYGRIYIKFNQPISLNDVLSQHGVSIQQMTPKELNVLCRNLGFRIINAINNVTVVTPYAVVASAILNCSRKKFSRNHMISHVKTCINYLHSQNAYMADTLLIDPEHAFEHAFDSYIQRKFIDRFSVDKESPNPESHFTISDNRRPSLEYYKNNSIAFFIPAAFTALTILDQDAFQFTSSELHRGYLFLQEFFKNEFAYDVEKKSEFYVRKTIKSFIDDAILMPHQTLPDTYNITSSGYRKLKFFARFLKSYFESYLVVLNYFAQNKHDIGDKDQLKKIQILGERMYKREAIELKEALSKVNYINAINYFNYHDIKGSRQMKKIDFYNATIQRYLNLLLP